MDNSPDPRRQALKKLSSMSDDDYRTTIRELTPELDGGTATEDPDLKLAGWPGRNTVDLNDAMDLSRGKQSPTLNAYLACALTGLADNDKQLMEALSHRVAVLGSDLNFDVYEPRNITDPVHHADVPDWEVWQKDRETVLNSDLLIHLAHFPSTGSGEELSFAFDALVPIIVISRAGHRVSRMVTGIPGLVFSVTYDEPEELVSQLQDVLLRVRPILEVRRTSLADNSENVFGSRIRALREVRGLTISELAEATSKRVHISPQLISKWETSTDQESMPSLIQMREIATHLGVSVGELVDPMHDTAFLGYLERYIALQAARGAGDSKDDRRLLKRKVLERLLHQIDE